MRAGVFDLPLLLLRPLRTSCWMVGTRYLEVDFGCGRDCGRNEFRRWSGQHTGPRDVTGREGGLGNPPVGRGPLGGPA